MKAAEVRESEASFQRAVLEAARAYGWTVYFAWKSFHSPKGWPDLFCVKAGVPRALAIECKSARGQLTPEQSHCLALLRQVPGIEVYEWRPDSWPEILACFRGDHHG
jgi:hypothetical protein